MYSFRSFTDAPFGAQFHSALLQPLFSGYLSFVLWWSNCMRNCREVFITKVLFIIFFSVSALTGTAASRRDGTPTNCGPCQGGITTLTFQYLGTSTALIVIKDSKATYFSGVVAPNQLITVSGTRSNGTFLANQLELVINGFINTVLNVNCGQDIFVNATYGKFLVTAGASRQGGPLCCAANTDTTPPTIQDCPQDIQDVAGKGNCVQAVTWTPPTASDDCALSDLTSTHASGENFPIGTTSVVYTATDASGNTSTCTFKVIIKDDQSPVFQNCPTDIVARTTEATAVVKWGALTASDNCGNVNITGTHTPGDLFPVGTTKVTYTATDNAGNSALCNFTVIVQQVTEVSDTTLHVATFLTPDGDGINDSWTIDNIGSFSKNSVTIVDRWGNVIFTASPYDNQRKAWDGTDSSGKKVAAGTYFYSLNLGNGTRVKKGFIEVIH